MHNLIDRSKSLQELDGQDWGEPNFHSHLVETLHRLRRKPLKDFSIEDLRICILQNIGLPYLMPLAIEWLEQNPLAEGDYYPGDLLVAVLRIDGSFWPTHPTVLRRVRESQKKASSLLPPEDDACSEALAEAEKVFVARTQHLP